MQNAIELVGKHFFDMASLLMAVAALIYAARAFRVAKQAIEIAKESDLINLKMKAQDGRAKAERSFTSLQSACRNVRDKWEVHHQNHYPLFGHHDFRNDDTDHIALVEREGRKLLKPLAISQVKMKTMKPDDLEVYIAQTEAVARQIDKLALRLHSPKRLVA